MLALINEKREAVVYNEKWEVADITSIQQTIMNVKISYSKRIEKQGSKLKVNIGYKKTICSSKFPV